MRFVLVFALLLASSSAVVWQYPEFLPESFQSVSLQAERLLSDKEIQISGLSVLSRSDILKDLPIDKSVIWWQAHARDVEVALERNPLIQDATIERCPGGTLRCFDVHVKERQPAFIVNLGDRVWLLGEDGGFITPVPKKKFEEKGALVVPTKTPPVIVEGLLGDSLSPDVVKARIRYVRSVIEVVEPETGLKVRTVEVRTNGETALRFNDLDLRAVFDAGADNLERVREEARRLKTILANFGEHVSQIAQVDLAFDKVAVTKLKGAQS